MVTIHPPHQSDLLHWAAARAVGTSCQLLVSRLARASSSQHVTDCLRAALQLFGTEPHPDIRPNAAPSAAADDDDTADIQQLCLQQHLQQHAAVLGWPALRVIFLQDQFESWASVVLSGEQVLSPALDTACPKTHPAVGPPLP